MRAKVRPSLQATRGLSPSAYVFPAGWGELHVRAVR